MGGVISVMFAATMPNLVKTLITVEALGMKERIATKWRSRGEEEEGRRIVRRKWVSHNSFLLLLTFARAKVNKSRNELWLTHFLLTILLPSSSSPLLLHFVAILSFIPRASTVIKVLTKFGIVAANITDITPPIEWARRWKLDHSKTNEAWYIYSVRRERRKKGGGIVKRNSEEE